MEKSAKIKKLEMLLQEADGLSEAEDLRKLIRMQEELDQKIALKKTRIAKVRQEEEQRREAVMGRICLTHYGEHQAVFDDLLRREVQPKERYLFPHLFPGARKGQFKQSEAAVTAPAPPLPSE